MGPFAQVRHSLVSHGCIINGTVENSVLGPGVKVLEGAHIRDSVIMLDAEIGQGCVVHRAIIDKGVHIGTGAQVGAGDDYAVNVEEPDRLTAGITVVGKYAEIPAGAWLGRNVRVDTNVVLADWDSTHVPAGGTVHARAKANLDDGDAE
jgi:glucose-1-phosphate adenylyltransferase